MAQSNTFATNGDTNGDTLSLTLPATTPYPLSRPRLLTLTLVAEAHISLQGFGGVQDKRWKINTLEVVLDQSGMKINIYGISGRIEKMN